MDSHREIFNDLLHRWGYSAKQVSAWSGVHESRLSRFRNGKLDLEIGEFFHLLESMPQEAQDFFWTQNKLRQSPLKKMITGMNQIQLSELLIDIAKCLQDKPPRQARQKGS